MANWTSVPAVVVSGRGATGTKPPEPASKGDGLFHITGMRKQPGSLNVRTTDRRWFRRRAGHRFGSFLIFPGRLGGIDVIVAKQNPSLGASPYLLHLYSAELIRPTLGVEDGDTVYLEVPTSCCVRATWLPEVAHRVRMARKATRSQPRE